MRRGRAGKRGRHRVTSRRLGGDEAPYVSGCGACVDELAGGRVDGADCGARCLLPQPRSHSCRIRRVAQHGPRTCRTKPNEGGVVGVKVRAQHVGRKRPQQRLQPRRRHVRRIERRGGWPRAADTLAVGVRHLHGGRQEGRCCHRTRAEAEEAAGWTVSLKIAVRENDAALPARGQADKPHVIRA